MNFRKTKFPILLVFFVVSVFAFATFVSAAGPGTSAMVPDQLIAHNADDGTVNYQNDIMDQVHKATDGVDAVILSRIMHAYAQDGNLNTLVSAIDQRLQVDTFGGIQFDPTSLQITVFTDSTRHIIVTTVNTGGLGHQTNINAIHENPAKDVATTVTGEYAYATENVYTLHNGIGKEYSVDTVTAVNGIGNTPGGTADAVMIVDNTPNAKMKMTAAKTSMLLAHTLLAT